MDSAPLNKLSFNARFEVFLKEEDEDDVKELGSSVCLSWTFNFRTKSCEMLAMFCSASTEFCFLHGFVWCAGCDKFVGSVPTI